MIVRAAKGLVASESIGERVLSFLFGGWEGGLDRQEFWWFNLIVLNRQKQLGLARIPALTALLLGILGCFQPAAARQASATSSPATALSGYGELHFNKFEFQDGTLDLRRFVLLVTHEFNPRLRFVSEVEIEHAVVEGLEEEGELEIEQAYLDFLITRAFNVRAGMLLVPMGIINERHEPPVFYGVERPLVDTVVIPTTWFDVGAGVHGEVGRGWRYRAYVMAPLNAAEFNAEEGLREGQQNGSEANVGRVAVTGRLEYVGHRGLTLGAGFWSGKSGFEFRPRFDVPVTVVEADGRYTRGRVELRGQFAQVSIDNAGLVNDTMTLRTGVNPNIAESLRGAYGEAAYRVISGARMGDVAFFTRYENVDTQRRMPEGFLPLKAFDRDQWVIGATYWPDPDVAVKVDYIVARNKSEVLPAPNSFNIGLGWWF
jgi:hypothetical protein